MTLSVQQLANEDLWEYNNSLRHGGRGGAGGGGAGLWGVGVGRLLWEMGGRTRVGLGLLPSSGLQEE